MVPRQVVGQRAAQDRIAPAGSVALLPQERCTAATRFSGTLWCKGSMVQSTGPVVRIALLIVLDHRSVYIGIRHADHGAGWSGCQKLGFRVFFVMENDKIKNHT